MNKARTLMLKKNLGLSSSAGFTILLDNYGSLMWVGQVLMGKSYFGMNVVFDTGSDWLVIQGSTCTNCNGTTFVASGGT